MDQVRQAKRQAEGPESLGQAEQAAQVEAQAEELPA